MSHALPATMTEALQFSPMGAGMWPGDAETSNVRAIPYVEIYLASSAPMESPAERIQRMARVATKGAPQ